MDSEKFKLRLEIRPTVQTRSPRELLIFSLDDTLIDTSLYWLARAHLGRAGAAKSGNAGSETDEKRVYEPSAECDSETMHHAWLAFQKQCVVAEGGDADLQLLVARSLRSRYPLAVAGAEDLLKWAQDRFTMVLLTSGDREVQLQKIEAAKLKGFFKEVKVVASKGIEDFRGVMSELGFSPRNTWILGDSIRCDINPGIAARANCIHYANAYAKHLGIPDDVEEPVGKAFRIHDLADARAILAKSSNTMAA